MNPFIIVAQIVVKEGSVEFVKTEACKMLAPTRAEVGCIKYVLNQDNQNPCTFIFYEEWETRELWLEHMQSKHLIEYRESIKDHVESVQLHEMTCLG